MKKITHKEACIKLQEKGMTLLEEYRGRDYTHLIRCSCGNEKIMHFGNAVSGKGGCSECFRYKIEFTEERKQNMSKALKGKFAGELNPNYGKSHSEEAKAKIGTANFKYGLPSCNDCGKKLKRYNAKLCQSCNTKGERNPMYIEDRSLLRDEGFRVSGTNAWRISIHSMFNGCVICGSVEDLHAHHLEPYRDYTHLRVDILNGVSACKYHHREFHSKYGKTGFNRDDFVEYYINKIEEVA